MARGSRRRTWLVAVVAVAMSAASLPASAAAGPGPTKAPRFTDGAWSGDIVYAVSAQLPQGGITTQGLLNSAHFEMQVAGGSVSGSYEGTGTLTVNLPGGSGSAVTTLTGTLGGDSAHPVVMPANFSASGTAVLPGGNSAPIEYSLDASGQKSGTFDVVDATCTTVTGTFEQSVEGNLAAAGGTAMTLVASFAAIRQSEASGSAGEALKQLMDTASQILQAFELDQTFDPAAVFELVKSAESFDASLQKNAACGTVGDVATFSIAVTGVVKQMLQLAFGTFADKFTTAQLADLLFAGVSAGAVGSGAVDQQASDEILAAAQDELGQRLDAAITSGAKAEIQTVLEVAVAMGWTKLATQAQSALKKLK